MNLEKNGTFACILFFKLICATKSIAVSIAKSVMGSRNMKTQQKAQIRLASPKDIDRIVQMASQVQKMIRQRRSVFFRRITEFQRSRSFYTKALRKKDRILYVAELDGEVVGYAYAVIEKTPDDLISIPYVSFDELAVDKGYRGLGIGREIIEVIHKWAHDKKVGVIQLGVWEFNQNALKLYETFGYKTIMRKMEKVLRKR